MPKPLGFEHSPDVLRCTECSTLVPRLQWLRHEEWHSKLDDLFEDLERRRSRSGTKKARS